MQRNFYQTPYYQPSQSGESVIVPQTIEPEPVPVTESELEPEAPHASTQHQPEPNKISFYNPETKRFFNRFCVDDVILIAIILLLITDSEIDIVMLVILGFLLLTGLE